MRVGIAESPCPARKRWTPALVSRLQRQAGCPSADSCWTRMLRTDTDTSPLSRNAGAPAEHAGRNSPNSHAPRVNAAHQRWCPGFSRQAWLPECRFKLDTDATDGHGYIALEPLCGAQRSMRVGLPNPHAPRVNAAHQHVPHRFPLKIHYRPRSNTIVADSLLPPATCPTTKLVHAQNTRASSLLQTTWAGISANRTSRASLPRQMSCSLQLETAPCLVVGINLRKLSLSLPHARLARLCSRRFILTQN